MGNRKQLSAEKIFNCFFPILYLLITGRLCGIIIAWPLHFMGITWQGRLIHFKTTRKKDMFSPLWFEGYMEVLRYSTVPRAHITLSFSRRERNGYKRNITN